MGRRVSPAKNSRALFRSARGLPSWITLLTVVGCGSGDEDPSATTSSGSDSVTSTSGNSATNAGTSSTTGAVGEPSSGQACELGARVGTLGLRLSDEKTLLSGAILDSVNPEGVFDIVASEGDCS